MAQLQGETRPWGHKWRSSELFTITATSAALLTGTDSACHDNQQIASPLIGPDRHIPPPIPSLDPAFRSGTPSRARPNAPPACECCLASRECFGIIPCDSSDHSLYRSPWCADVAFAGPVGGIGWLFHYCLCSFM